MQLPRNQAKHGVPRLERDQRIIDDGAGAAFDSRRFEVRTQPMVGSNPGHFLFAIRKQEFRFYRYRAGEGVLVLEINEFPETSPVVLPAP